LDERVTQFSLPPWPWLLVAGFGAYEFLYLAEYWIKALSSPDLRFDDFRGFWSFAKFVCTMMRPLHDRPFRACADAAERPVLCLPLFAGLSAVCLAARSGYSSAASLMKIFAS
jgi:hypothetical protein